MAERSIADLLREAADRIERQTGDDLLPHPDGEKMTRCFLQELVSILLAYITKTFDRSSKVLDFHHPHQLKEGLEGFSLELPDQPENLEQLLVDCRDTLKYGVKTGHPRFLNQLSTGLDIIGLAGEWLTSTANTNIGKMIPVELESSILRAKNAGCVPFYVNATAGTTVYGAFDPFLHIADICSKHGLWMHVDAAWGGGLLLSERHCGKLRGIERASSVTWNPHKIMGVPQQCSALLVKKKGILLECNQLGAQYLFQPDKPYDVSYDTGDKSIQCGRHVDVFKLWLMWKAKGSEGFGSQINRCLENAEHLFNLLSEREDFELVFKSKPEHSNVCFWYIPPSLRVIAPEAERDRRLHEVAPKIKAKMMETGSVMIGYQPTTEKVNFFRCVFSNPATTKEDVDFLLDEIVRLGCGL
ncbi:glutamate decarboxylase 1 isoform X2 [Conger conger]|uniref:glutamate decarboxylase 1 isoform X2 n=1 Tax=Conger conger TaxID=82655 RepID=UPI002A5AE72A|nr:glutamate decarboxylase 1 isoform X2 [Conger conger]